jgi:glutathione S-transferase
MAPMDLAVYLVIALAAAQLIVFGFLVGRGRAKYGVPAPAMSGNPTWERLNRVHQNSLEAFVVFAPLFTLYAFVVGRFTGLILGVVFLIARILYAVGYARAPEKRELGAFLTSIVQVVLALGVIGSLIFRFFQPR